MCVMEIDENICCININILTKSFKAFTGVFAFILNEFTWDIRLNFE